MVTQHNFFETKVVFDTMSDGGKVVKETESYLVDALSFSEAEALTIKEVEPYMSGEFSVEALKRSKIYEVFETDAENGAWFKAKIEFIILDEEKGTEKRQAATIMVEAENIQSAIGRLNENMKGTMSDWELVGIGKTGIVGVVMFETGKEEENEN